MNQYSSPKLSIEMCKSAMLVSPWLVTFAAIAYALGIGVERSSRTKSHGAGPLKSIMRMFDSLIYNVDRRPENYLVNESTGKLYLIDHGRSFRVKTGN